MLVPPLLYSVRATVLRQNKNVNRFHSDLQQLGPISACHHSFLNCVAASFVTDIVDSRTSRVPTSPAMVRILRPEHHDR